MTNADVPSLALEGIIDKAVNPFTGKVINSDEKTAHEQFISLSNDWEIAKNNGNTYTASKWVSVKDDIWDKENWTFYDDTIVLSEHSIN